jgi:hypothetical protein
VLCFSTFCLDAKGGAKKSRQTQMAPPVLPAHAQQQSYSIRLFRASFQAACFTFSSQLFQNLMPFL